MRRVAIGLLLGIFLGATAHGEETVGRLKLTEETVATVRGTPVKIPEEYGRLINVVVSSEVHYLYFEDGEGNIRVVLVGPRGAVQRSRNPLQLLTSEVQFIKRGRPEDDAGLTP